MAGIPSRLCSGTQSGGVSVVALETTRTTELLPEHLCPAERPCSSRAQADAPQIHSGDGLLAAGRPLSLVSILCGTQITVCYRLFQSILTMFDAAQRVAVARDMLPSTTKEHQTPWLGGAR